MRFLFSIIFFFSCSIAFADGKLDNCLQYKEEIVSILEHENVSNDYFYLAVCESGCKIKTSNKGARGFFQLMNPTFKSFGDPTCSDIDDIKCNTIAAARYLKHLQNKYKANFKTSIKMYNRGGSNYIRKGSTAEADNLAICVMRYIKINNTI